MDKPVYLVLLILQISNLVMNEFWYDHVKPEHREKGKLCYKDTHSFIVSKKIEEIYVYIAKGVETISDTSNH